MSTTVSALLSAQVQFTLDQTNLGMGDSVNSTPLVKQLNYSDGAGSGAVNTVYSALLTLAASGTATLNLTNSSLFDVLNVAVLMARVKAVFIQLLSTTDDATNGTACSAITVAGLNGAAGFIDGTTPKRRIFNGGFEAFGVGNAAGVTSGMTLTVVNEDTVVAAAYVITVFGAKT